MDHTFKETAKKFGIHHSTVSGWVKESEKADKCANFGDFYREKGRVTSRGIEVRCESDIAGKELISWNERNSGLEWLPVITV